MPSIIITNYNKGELLRGAIESALRQTVKCDVIVVDDGSTDGSKNIPLGYPIRIILQNNRGASAARNTGISRAEDGFVMCLDADDVISERYMEECIDMLGSYDIVGSAFIKDGNYIYLNGDGYTPESFFIRNRMHNGAVYHKKIWADLGGYDEFIHGFEDWEFWTRASVKGHSFYMLKEPLYLQNITNGLNNKVATQHVSFCRFLRNRYESVGKKQFRS